MRSPVSLESRSPSPPTRSWFDPPTSSSVPPGSRATVSDLDWLRRNGLAEEIVAAAAAGRTVIGICGGYQMLARSIDDPIESKAGLVEGLGLLPTAVRFGA